VTKLYSDKLLNKKYYPLKNEVEIGTYLAETGKIEALSKKQWQQKKKKYEQILKDQK